MFYPVCDLAGPTAISPTSSIVLAIGERPASPDKTAPTRVVQSALPLHPSAPLKHSEILVPGERPKNMADRRSNGCSGSKHTRVADGHP